MGIKDSDDFFTYPGFLVTILLQSSSVATSLLGKKLIDLAHFLVAPNCMHSSQIKLRFDLSQTYLSNKILRYVNSKSNKG